MAPSGLVRHLYYTMDMESQILVCGHSLEKWTALGFFWPTIPLGPTWRISANDVCSVKVTPQWSLPTLDAVCLFELTWENQNSVSAPTGLDKRVATTSGRKGVRGLNNCGARQNRRPRRYD